MRRGNTIRRLAKAATVGDEKEECGFGAGLGKASGRLVGRKEEGVHLREMEVGAGDDDHDDG